MKYLMIHIKGIFEYYQHYFNHSRSIFGPIIEQEIQQYVDREFKKIKTKQYFFVNFNEKNQLFEYSVDPDFEEQMKTHYPEKLI